MTGCVVDAGGNGDFAGDGPCGGVVAEGNMFADPRQRPKALSRYIANLVSQTKAANALLPQPASAVDRHRALFALHSYISEGRNDSSLFQDSRVLDRHGNHAWDENCTKPGGPSALDEPLFFGDGHNSYSASLTRYITEGMELGLDGFWHDDFPMTIRTYTYGTRDNVSVFLDAQTLAVRADNVGSLVLLTQAHELSMLGAVHRHGGIYVCNGSPQTRTWMQQPVRTLNVAECGFASRSYFTQLYTPMMLTRYGGDVWDEDPRYNHSDVPLLPADARLAFMTDPCVSLTDNLDFGVISAGYGGLWHNTSTANIFSAITPITATEVSRHDIAEIWVAFFSRSQRYRC